MASRIADTVSRNSLSGMLRSTRSLANVPITTPIIATISAVGPRGKDLPGGRGEGDRHSYCIYREANRRCCGYECGSLEIQPGHGCRSNAALIAYQTSESA